MKAKALMLVVCAALLFGCVKTDTGSEPEESRYIGTSLGRVAQFVRLYVVEYKGHEYLITRDTSNGGVGITPVVER